MKLSLVPLTILLSCAADPKHTTSTNGIVLNSPKPKYDFEVLIEFDRLNEMQKSTGQLVQFEDVQHGNSVTMNLITNITTETRIVTFTNLMLQCVTTNAGGVFTNLVPIMTIGTNVGWEVDRHGFEIKPRPEDIIRYSIPTDSVLPYASPSQLVPYIISAPTNH